MLKVITACEEHGLEAIEIETVALSTPDGRIFTFSVDPESGGLLVGAGGETLSVGLFSGPDGEPRPDALVLMAPRVLDWEAAPASTTKRHLN
mgnify:CR=1 FL=1